MKQKGEMVYIRLEEALGPREAVKRLIPPLESSEIEYDSEDRFEWVYLDLPTYGLSLNISRDHGRAGVDAATLDGLAEDSPEWRALVQPGPTYICALDGETRASYREMDTAMIQWLSDRLGCKLAVFAGSLNVEELDGEPDREVAPAG